ncbi:MAG: GAF domain-containing protein [Anaerolineae bacterium]|nr:GAF domain-containing protein [Anaerolineae bacterium]
MLINESNQPNGETPDTHSGTLLSKLLPILETRWTILSDTWDFNDWQHVLNSAVHTPQTLPLYLSKFLQDTPWSRLIECLDITLKAAQATPSLNATEWQMLLVLHQQILNAAAQTFSGKEQKPIGAPLLAAQTLTQLHQKIALLADPAQMLDEILALLQNDLGHPFISLYVLNASRTTLTLQHTAWRDHPRRSADVISLPASQGTLGRVVTTKQPVWLNQTMEVPHFRAHPALPEVQSHLAVPISFGQNLMGVLAIENDQPDAFTENDPPVAQALADQIAIAIENARLYQAQQRATREQSTLFETIVTLSTERDSTEVLGIMSRRITQIIDAGACIICMMDEKDKTVTAIAEYVAPHTGNLQQTWRPLNIPLAIAADFIGQQILKIPRPIIRRAPPDHIANWQKPRQGQGLWNIVLAIPFEIKPLVRGFVEIYDQNRHRTFSSEDAKICRMLVMQTAMAIEQAHLFDQAIQRLSEMSLLYIMAQKISSSLDLEDVLNMIVTSLRQAIGCRACCIFLLDETTQLLEIKAADGLKPQWRKAAKLKLGEGAAGRAAAEGRSIYLPDTHQDDSYVFFDKDVKSLLVVPLVAQGKIIGTINVDDDRTHAFGSTQERLLTIAAAQAGITIENARLFTKVSEEQQQMQAVIQYMADGLLLIDSQGTIITCNPPLAMMLGVSPLQIIGKNVEDPHLHPNLNRVTRSITHHARTGVLATEISIDSPHPRALQVFSTPVTGDKKEKFGEVRLIHDVTKERELDQLKDDFYSTISHELRTPLFSIQGFAQIMLEEEELAPTTQREFLETIQRQAQQLGEMVNNLLDLSKFDAGKMEITQEPVALLPLIKQTVAKLQGFAHQNGINLVTELPSHLPPITGDQDRLEQVLTNLIGNAIKFSEPEQRVTITVSKGATDVIVKVKDNGIGIPAEDLDHIFSRYYQANNKSERSAMGSGLGLHIAKKIVEGHKGKIWAESEPRQGSTFCFTLPRTKTV